MQDHFSVRPSQVVTFSLYHLSKRLCQQYSLATDWDIDPLAAIGFLKAQAHYAEGQKDGQGSVILAKIEAAHYHLRIANVDLTKEIIDECTALSDKLHHIEPSISAAIYRVSADYHKVKPIPL